MAMNLDKISSKLLKFIINAIHLSVKLLGIWPYHYDRKSNSFHSTKTRSCYTAITMPFTFCAYIFAIKNIKVNDDKRVHIPSSTARITTILLSLIVISTYSISSVYLTTNYGSIIKWLKKSRKVIRKIHHFRPGRARLPFLRPVLHFILKMILINGLTIYASIGILSNLISDRSAGKSWLIVFYILPTVSITIICDIFYGSMLATTYYFRLLNYHLKTIVNELSSSSNNTRGYTSNQNSKQSIDEIDQLAILHLDVTTCTTMANRVFGIHLMCFMTGEVFLFISKLFIIYIIIEFEWRRQQSYQFNYFIMWYNAVIFVAPFWSIYLLSRSCHRTIKEVQIMKCFFFPNYCCNSRKFVLFPVREGHSHSDAYFG